MDQDQNRTISADIRGIAAHSRARRGIRESFIELWVEGLEINHLADYEWVLITPPCPKLSRQCL